MIGIVELQNLPDGLRSLTCLEELSIERCSKLKSLSPGLNHLTSLLKLSIEECPDLETLSPALCHLTLLQQLDISRCTKLKSLSPAEFSEESVALEESIPENSDSFFYHLSKLRTLHIDGDDSH
ncbi:hypothetical protein FEM48_Zijuj05G0132600 [Ziziphus jujuba var. spinosa]|uniref:Zer-1-like leucine-rich repeats region domain-containing protein n=1 Tax=Ziziphus jujuba var. spinosa TaxID=714518 RepID=A0A978VF17_ZIZJJ|nr:hypothetical protein FEM48_Zijuj05G0132600 [Ziziphus jujuba var. spinosa]